MNMETNVLSGRLAIFRINYKSDFILTLESDAGWMTPFCIKFWTGAPSQAYYVGWDGETYTHCVPVEGEPTKLQVQFDDHHLPIGELKYQVAYHFTVDDFPNDTEDEVINQAAVIIDNNGRDEKVLLDFNGETAPDIAFSLPAYANEAQRIANEQQRIANETQRIANEETRIQHEESRIAAEQTRQQNEQQRINQEQARVNEYDRLKADAVAATGAANDAAALATAKAQLAADKAALAQAAANLANAKAQLAADKAALAASAAQLANDKAALAQQKADYAQTQGNYAKAQGDYAKEQGDTALADHRRAEADHETAANDNTQAGNDHTRAESDHGIAVNDHTQAGNDHTRAESDHGIAADDHTQAGTDHQTAAADHQTAGADHTQAGNDHTRAESDHTRAESDHAAVEVYVDSLGAYDISAANAVGGVLATYADLTAALGTNGANIPEALRKGGMSVKFVLTSDNKYVQYFLTKNTWSASVADWEKMNLEEEVSQLGQETSQLQQILNGWKNYKEGVKLNLTGQEAVDSNYFITNKIPAVLGDSFVITSPGGYICSYQEDGTFCDVWTARTNITLNAPANTNAAYIIVSFLKSNIETAKVEKNNEVVWQPIDITGVVQKLAEMEVDLSAAIENVENLDTSVNSITQSDILQNISIEEHEIAINGGQNFKKGYHLSASGEYVADNNEYLVTNKIPAILGDSFIITSSGGYICSYKSDGTFCDVWTARTNITLSGIANNDAAYILCTFKVADISTAKVEKDNSIVWQPKDEIGLNKEVDSILTELPEKNNKLHLSLVDDESSYILSPFNETYDAKLYFRVKRSLSANHNQCFNFAGFYLVNKTTLAETNVDDCIDDIAPPFFNGSYLGGNHANNKACKLTIQSHGLSYSNIGEVWSYDNGGQATILAIIDTNNIVAIGKQTEVYPKFDFETIPTGSILSNGVINLTVTGSVDYQWYCATNAPDVDVFVDDKKIASGGNYICREIKICESYDIMNTQSVLEKLRLGVGTYSGNPNPASFTSADKCVRLTISYILKSAGQWFVATSLTAYQNIDLGLFGFTQQGAIPTSHLYIPKALPVSVDNDTIDFRTAPLYPAHNNTILINAEKSENPLLPPDRWLSFNDNIAIHSGFLFDFGVGGEERKNVVNNYFYLPSNLKIYPLGIDKKITVNAGDSYAGVIWRTFIDRSVVNTGGIISVNIFVYDGKLYIYADFNQAGIYELKIPNEYVGKMIDVFEKSDNVSLLTPISGRCILVKVLTASPLYGYMVATI